MTRPRTLCPSCAARWCPSSSARCPCRSRIRSLTCSLTYLTSTSPRTKDDWYKYHSQRASSALPLLMEKILFLASYQIKDKLVEVAIYDFPTNSKGIA
jgi:hypothetical protein